MRLGGVGGGPDANRFAAQWGYTSGSETAWAKVSNWQSVDLGPIHSHDLPLKDSALGFELIREGKAVKPLLVP